MGSSTARCCSVSAPDQESRRNPEGMVGRLGSLVGSLEGVKSVEEYKAQYKERGTLAKQASVITVESNEHRGQYVCRRLKLSDAPCQDKAIINQHLQALNSLDHPHVCKFIEAFEDRKYVYLIYEKANPLTLFEHIRLRGSLMEEEAADYLRQAAMALSVSHEKNIHHGRLSPRSIVLADDEEDDDEECDTQVKICDMGQTFIWRPSILDAKETDKTLEDLKYAMSPEIASEGLGASDGSVPSGAAKNDVWALGVIFYHMLSGTTPFKVTNRKDLVEQMCDRQIKFHDAMWNKLSTSARDIIEQMMRLHPGIRISAARILKHPWVKVAKATFPKKRMVALLQNMADNCQESEFKRFVLRVIATQLPGDGKHMTTVETAFRCLDRNDDGILSVEEVIKGLKKHLGKGSEDTELENLFMHVDRDASGTLNVAEFVSASMPQSRSTSLPVLWEAFNAFDKDRSASVTFEEIDRIVREIEGAMLSQSQVSNICTEIRRELESVSTNGSIDLDQFVFIMSNANPNFHDNLRTGVARFLWEKCGFDNYKVRHLQVQQNWDLSQTGPRGPRSVYRSRSNRPRERDSDRPNAAG